MGDLIFKDDSFDANQSGNYFLYLQSGLDGFTYVICDAPRKKCCYFQHYSLSCTDWKQLQPMLEVIFREDPLLSVSYKQVFHIINHPQQAILPESFVPGDDAMLSTFLPLGNPEEEILVKSYSEISKSFILTVYPEYLVKMLQVKFEGIRLSHHTLPFIQCMVSESIRSLRYIFHLQINNSFITLGVAHAGNLDFINIFKVTTVEDIIYFTMTVLDKFKVSPSVAEIFFTNQSSYPDLLPRMKEFISKVRNLKEPHSLVYSPVIPEEVKENFSNLINVYNCE